MKSTITEKVKIKKTLTDNNGYPYTIVDGDENKVRTYLLDNGLTVFLAQNFDAPRIQTYIPVKTGSNNDPADNTGLSHYLEHMLFKGTSKIGTKNWGREKKLLDTIADLFELHKAEQNPEKKRKIYKKIDEVSQEASQYALANEYDKIISSLGATGTNAHTWLDETVYKNNIPKNELENWLRVEQERFSELVLRLFHTELESVYEEFNRAQDNDSRLVNYALMEELFPTHPNGQQTTLGKVEHLKNPSMKALYKYFDDFYVPNNYALVLVGDLDFEETIALIDKYFGKFKYKKLPKREKIIEKPLTKITKRVVKSPTIPRVQIAWRTDSYGTQEALLADVVANILSNNGEAGLMDLNINQKQKMLWAQAFSMGMKNYGYFSAVAVPKENQTLDDGIKMMLEEIEKIKTGDFPEWMLPAMINDFKTQRIKAWETADGLATTLYDTFIKERTWSDEIEEMKLYESFTKENVMEFAKNFFKDNFVVVYKEKGVNENLIRVENPGITPIQINREEKSEFFKMILKKPTQEIQPEFIDYKKAIVCDKILDKKLSFVKNPYNNLAQLHYIFPFGSDHDNELSLAFFVLQYLGTKKYSAEELKKEFYKIGVTNDFKIKDDTVYISLSGLEENLPKGLDLLHHWLNKVKPDAKAYKNYISSLLEGRNAAKKDKNKIMNALVNYAKYGSYSRYTNAVSEERLKEIQCNDLTEKIKNFLEFPYQIFYYGKEYENIKAELQKYTINQTKPAPKPIKYPQPGTNGKVFFANYDMVQVEMSKVAKGKPVNPELFGTINVFNEYFGRGLSSIVFQEIRESKSLAYSAYVAYQANPVLHKPDFVTTYVGTQPDKLRIAIETMSELMSELPQIPIQFNNARKAMLKQIASTRITRTQIFFKFLDMQKLGLTYDLREDMYYKIEKLSLRQLTEFYDKQVKALKYNIAIIGKKENLDKKAIKEMGPLKEVTLEDIFGF